MLKANWFLVFTAALLFQNTDLWNELLVESANKTNGYTYRWRRYITGAIATVTPSHGDRCEEVYIGKHHAVLNREN